LALQIHLQQISIYTFEKAKQKEKPFSALKASSIIQDIDQNVLQFHILSLGS